VPFPVNLYRLFVAAPSDVTAERTIVHDVIAEWNAVNSRDFHLAFEPVSWLSHAVAEDGDRPQAILNRQVVDSSDILAGVFWTRLGTPTGEATSGTVEEINRFRAAGKPVALFFSNAPVNPDVVDELQLAALRAFRSEAQEAGLCTMHRSLDEFRTHFQRYLSSLARDLRVSRDVPDPIRRYIESCPDFGAPSDLAVSRVRTSRGSFYTALQCVLSALEPGTEVVSSDSISFARASGISYWVTEGLQFLGFTHEAATRGVRFTRVFVVRSQEIEKYGAVLIQLCKLHNLAGITTMVAPSEALPPECLYEYVVFGDALVDEAIYDLHGEQIVDNYIYWARDKVAACRERSGLLRSYASKYPESQRRRATTFDRVSKAAEALRRSAVETAHVRSSS
jgi:hypothetical protein